MANRIDESCWYKVIGPEVAPNTWRSGTLRAWSTDHEEYDEGPGLIPVAVIEDDKTAMCHSVYVGNVCFTDSPPQ